MHRNDPDRPGRRSSRSASQPAPEGQPQSPYEWVHTAKPAKSSRTGWIIFGGIAATVIAVVIIVVFQISTRGGTSTTSSQDSRKADIKQLTSSMLVDRSSFPEMKDARFLGPKMAGNSPQSVSPIDPPECSALVLQTMSQSVTGGLTDGKTIMFNATIALLTERSDFKSVVSKCGTFKVGAVTSTVTQRSLPGLPEWATAILLTTSALPDITELEVMGYYRGVLIQSGCRKKGAGDPSEQDIASLVKIFKDQVARLEAAP